MNENINLENINANDFENFLLQKTKTMNKTIIFPESEDERILKTIEILSSAVQIILLGDENDIKLKAKNLKIDLKNTKIINHLNSPFFDEFAKRIYDLRKHKGIDLDQAKVLLKDKNYFATMMVEQNYADAMISGAVCSTADTIRPALQIIKTKQGISSVSGAFLMCVNNKVLFFSDCAVNPNPSEEELAQNAKITSDMAKKFGLNPKVAFLSFSTLDSAKGEMVDKIKNATILAQKMGVNADGPIQFDAAINPQIAKSKMPNSNVAGNANVFIFPDLNAGNICYKAIQQTTNCLAIGPILLGLNKVVNDLSRGCTVKDIVNTALISAIMSEN